MEIQEKQRKKVEQKLKFNLDLRQQIMQNKARKMKEKVGGNTIVL